MRIKIHEKKKDEMEKPMPELDFVEDPAGGYGFKIIAVSPYTGEWMADLVVMTIKGLECPRSARTAIERDGYSSAFAEWDGYGSYVRLISDDVSHTKYLLEKGKLEKTKCDIEGTDQADTE